MLTSEQKARVNQRFLLYTEFMADEATDEKKQEILEAVKAITAQMSDDETWTAESMESAYMLGLIDGAIGVTFS